jgi:hypothetical protein
MKGVYIMKKTKKYTNCRCSRKSFPLISVLSIAAAYAAYSICKKQSDKRYFEKWKDYDECGI